MTLTLTGRLCDCALMSFGTPADSVRHLVPKGLELLTRGDRAFWNVVTCRVDRMRPKHLPAAVGVTYHHVAYRLLVQAMTQRAQLLQGLYFVRSDADAAVLGAVGNATTDFKFHRAQVTLDATADRYRAAVTTDDGAGDARFELAGPAPAAGPRHRDSAFATHLDAQEWLTYRPLGLSVGGPPAAPRLHQAQVHRDPDAWRETPVRLTGCRSAVFDALQQTPAHGLLPEHATRVADMDYTWRLGHAEPLLTPATPREPAGIA